MWLIDKISLHIVLKVLEIKSIKLNKHYISNKIISHSSD